MSDNEELQNYNYDLGYYEGVRNILQMIIKNLQVPTKTEVDRIDLLLKEVREEVDDAIACQKRSEKIFFDGY
jgi:hypothetical protein